MTIVIEVRNVASGAVLKMELDPADKIYDIIESAAEYWNKDAGAYVLKKGKKLLHGLETVAEANLVTNDVVEMIPDPEGGI